jgi:integrase/recombinase XerD
MLLTYWDRFKTYLLIEKKQSASNVEKRISSAFKLFTNYFDTNNLEWSRENFNAFISYLLERRHKPSYINFYIKVAKHFDRFLKTSELEGYTYFKENHDSLVETLTPEEITALAECRVKYVRLKKEKSLRMRALILFLGIVGSRISETLSLKRTDLISNPHPMVYFRPEITKSGKGRYCVIPPYLYGLLLGLPESQTIFNLEETSFNEDLKVRARKCNIKKRVYAHLFRHSSINNKLASGMPLELVTNYHGHASTATTYKYYIHLQQKQMVEALYMYDPFFKKGLTYDALCDRVKETVSRIVDKRFNYTVSESEGKLTIIIAQ